MQKLPANEHKVLSALATQGRDAVDLMELAQRLEMDQAQVDPAVRWLQEKGWCKLAEESYEELQLGKEGQLFADGRFPERQVIEALDKVGGEADMVELVELTGLAQKHVGQSLRPLKQKGWAEKSGRTVRLLEGGRAALKAGPGADEHLVKTLGKLEKARPQTLREAGVDVEKGLGLLQKRGGFLKTKSRTQRTVMITEAGKHQVAAGIAPRREVNELTSELLKDGEWQEVEFRPYDLSLPSYEITPGKIHPFRRILLQTRRVFLEMGFREVHSPYVESAFWDFDALFQPQDHPAREMQDTFYLARPKECRLPENQRLAKVRDTHVNGGETGSLGWRVPWSVEKAKRAVLRTHTTAATVRALAAHPKPPHKVFCVGRVFRRETVDYKHLPVFHQVDGIIIDEHASFAALLGTLEAFYKKMGFDRFEFRPAFFPYTEPSVEVFVWHEKRKDWFEMGGAGVFRPEVTQPQGCTVPVLAWGLGLERLAMFRYELSDIRQTCLADLAWLKETPLCR
jgi:phenylalanyl-tRNA synthetase alpha chain